ncbi:MAG TPA: hypothetical protein VGQ23_21355 [Burkholderiaceae bacterium]|jgi:hypothetical protein|nr:hypothetical protein [Burkholderiaceae bacterium]
MPNNTNHIAVTVDASGNVACNPDPVPVRGSNATLRFEVQTTGYAFPDNDAVIVSDPGTQFPDPSHTQGPSNTSATLHDNNTTAGSFKYTVTVKRLSDGQLIPYDPTILNET